MDDFDFCTRTTLTSGQTTKNNFVRYILTEFNGGVFESRLVLADHCVYFGPIRHRGSNVNYP